MCYTKNIFSFLKELRENNNKEWFDANKNKYLKAKSDFELLISEILKEMSAFDTQLVGLEPKDTIFRIYRDVRFSKNKEPYKNHFGAYLAEGGRKSELAGYYIHIQYDGSFLGAGAYCPPSPYLKEIRENIVDDPLKFKKIIEAKEYAEFFELENDKLKTVPRGFDKNFEYIDLIRYKNYVGISKMSNEIVTQDNFTNYVVDVFKKSLDLNNYLNYIAKNMD